MIFGTLWREVITRPLFNAFALLYWVFPFHDAGIAIILLTLVVRILLHPIFRSQYILTRIQPELAAIQKAWKSNREEQAKRTLALYRAHGVHPLAALGVFAQLFILFGLYGLFRGINHIDPARFYFFVPHFAAINPIAFHLVDLTKPSIPLALLAGLAQFLYARFATPRPPAPTSDSFSESFQIALWRQSIYLFPFVIAAIAWYWPSVLAVYWTAFNGIGMVQQRLIMRRYAHARAESDRGGTPPPDGH